MVYQPVPLILQEEPLDRRFNRGAAIRPGTVLVVATADGDAVTLNRRPGLGDGITARYRTQYTVDVTDHLSTLQENLPSRDDVFAFQTTIDVGWRVTDPREVVLRRVGDGLGVARSHLLDDMMPITRRYDQDDPARAERALNERLRSKHLALPEGITIFRASVRVAREKGTQEWVQEQVLQEREHQRRIGLQAGETSQAHHENAIADIAQQGRLRREQDRYIALRAALGGHDELLLRHLTVHPEDTAFALQSIAASRQADRDTQLGLIDRMISQGMLQPADAEGILARFAGLDVRPAIQPPSYGQPGPAALPGGPPAALPAGSRPAPGGSGPEPPTTTYGAPSGRSATGPAYPPPPTAYPAPGPSPTEYAPEESPLGVEPSNVGGWRTVGQSPGGPVGQPADELTIEEEERPIVEPMAGYERPTGASAPDASGGTNVAGWKKLRRPGE
ncbi:MULTISPECIES: hypothetical protein [Pseudofrankia]|uniref:hypothetical protein n=1 Tax=Pseudofrankia TaxID=2994363 RepID=UPI000234C2C7|nr:MULTISPECIES: hypothetical protein [Pseudofrankia]OHV35236.1 hypothetical protein BCD49_04540 [Pseudofrankia sp. EUN1h]